VDYDDSSRVNHATVLLLWYARPSKKIRHFVELGCATGYITFGISKFYSISGTGVDIKQVMEAPFAEGACINGVEEYVNFVNCDISELEKHFEHAKEDMVVFNPPHYEQDRGRKYGQDSRKTARAGGSDIYEKYAAAVNYLLKNRGQFYFVISAHNLTEWTNAFETKRLIIKRLKPVYGKSDNAQLVLIYGVKNANRGFLKLEKPVFL